MAELAMPIPTRRRETLAGIGRFGSEIHRDVRYNNHNNGASFAFQVAMRCLRKSRISLPSRRPDQGMTLVEIAIGVAVLGLVATAAIATLMILNKNAVSTRIMTNAREIVQRNIETAVGSPFTSSNVPAILATANNAVWDDDGGGDNLETIYTSRDGTAKVTGTLLRTVSAEANAAGADIRRVTFHLNYSVFGRPLSYEMTTIRATDK
jgi:prepilin-type N-terminal cleavage/methylation domain-containing protein